MMAISMQRVPAGRRLVFVIRVALSLALLLSIFLVSRQAVATWYFRKATLEGLQQALRWDPRNPEYHAALGRYYLQSFTDNNPAEAVGQYELAVQLSPHNAWHWAGLGDAYEVVGRAEDARRAYEKASERFPNSPEINWRLGNFYIRDGKTGLALKALQKALLGDPGIRRPAFDVAWRATEDADLILAEMIPPDSGIYFAYLNYLVETQRTDAAEKAWARLLELKLAFPPQQAFPYLDGLIRAARIEQMQAAWNALIERNPTLIRRPTYETNLITNGDLEGEILNGGLDWRVSPQPGVRVSVDSLTFFDGTHSLRLDFDGKQNVNYGHVFQYVPVKPNQSYRFTGYMRTQGITTDSGPRFEVMDVRNRNLLFLSSQNLVGTTSWSAESLEFQTGPQTTLLLIRVARPPSLKFDSQISGTVWIDRLTLHSVE
jgi:tetratricopeptide (TPR) repeat protein